MWSPSCWLEHDRLARLPATIYARDEHLEKTSDYSPSRRRYEVEANVSRVEALTDPRREFDLKWHATTILSVRKGDRVAIGGDGQVTLGTQVMKGDAVKIRKLLDGQVLVGFAGSAADGFALMERFEGKLKEYPMNVPRAATELAKLWRTDRMLRRLESVLIVVDARHSLLLTGSGDVIQPTDGILATGSGGGYALAAARALLKHSGLSAAEVVRESLAIASGIDIYTNSNLTVEELPCQSTSPNAS
jgi:ATP-dependent HslUV protease subunit HslV